MRPIYGLLLCLMSSAAFAQPAQVNVQASTQVKMQENRNPDIQRIEAVIEAFRTAIIEKDKARFVGLFVPGRVTWQSVRGDDTLRLARQKDPLAAKVRFAPEKTHLSFIDGIVGGTLPEEEKFSNIRIETDGDIASVFADYSFHQGERETNNGKEAWHLVRTEDGWKIASVVWSVNRKPAPVQIR